MNNKTKTKKRKTILGCQESNPSLLGERRLVNQMNNRFNIINVFYYKKDYEKKKKKREKPFFRCRESNPGLLGESQIS